MPFFLGLATDDELAAIAGSLAEPSTLTDVLDDWWLVAIGGVAPYSGALPVTEAIVGLGTARRRALTFCTASVITVDFGMAMVQTRSGFSYGLGRRAAPALPLPLAEALMRHLLA